MTHITVPDEPTATTFNVTTAQSVFAVTWTCFAKADIRVRVGATELAQSDFTFTGNPGTEGGFDGATITLNTAVSSTTVVIWRDIPVARTEDFGPGPVSSRDRNTALDRLTGMIQDRRRAHGESIRGTPGESMPALPGPSARAGQYLRFDEVTGAPTVTAVAAVPGSIAVDNITALRAATWPGGRPALVQLINNWATGDGGGLFRWDATSTATDNGGTIIKEAATEIGRWVRVSNQPIQASWFGAGIGNPGDEVRLLAAIDAAYDTGGLVVELDRLTYRLSNPLTIGNGAEGAEATRHQGIKLVGRNIPAAVGLSGIDQQNKGTRLVYEGPITSGAVVRFAGPITRVGMENIQVDADNRAGRPIELIHVAYGRFCRVHAHNYTDFGFYLTTRNNVGGVSYTTANNQFLECASWFPRGEAASGIFLGSGVPQGTGITGPRTTTRNTFIDCIFSYNGSTGASCGVELEGASANIFINVYANNTNSGTGASIRFTQRLPDTQFPYENFFSYFEALQNIAGTSGTYGNQLVWAWGDAQPIPSMENVRTILSDGRTLQGPHRSRDVKQSVHDATVTATNTTSTSFVDTDLITSITCKDANSLIAVHASGQVNKVGGGFMEAILVVNGTALGETIQTTNSGIGTQNFAMIAQITAVAGVNTVRVRIRSSDANTASLVRGSMLVQELY